MANAVSAADITLVKDGGKWRDTTSNREDSSENSSTIECSTYLKFLHANFCEVTFNGFHFYLSLNFIRVHQIWLSSYFWCGCSCYVCSDDWKLLKGPSRLENYKVCGGFFPLQGHWASSSIRKIILIAKLTPDITKYTKVTIEIEDSQKSGQPD